MTLTDLLNKIELVAYSVGLLPRDLRAMTPAETLAVISARIPNPQGCEKKPAEPEETPEEEMPKQTPEQIELYLKMLTASMGGKVVSRRG